MVVIARLHRSASRLFPLRRNKGGANSCDLVCLSCRTTDVWTIVFVILNRLSFFSSQISDRLASFLSVSDRLIGASRPTSLPFWTRATQTSTPTINHHHHGPTIRFPLLRRRRQIARSIRQLECDSIQRILVLPPSRPGSHSAR